jgi:hypothetical protein
MLHEEDFSVNAGREDIFKVTNWDWEFTTKLVMVMVIQSEGSHFIG